MRPTVFVVDDDDMANASVQALLEAHDIPSRCFSSAEDFLNAYDSEWCGCLLTDLALDGMSGLELRREMLNRNSQLQVIIITGHTARSSEFAALHDTAFAVLEKPYAGSALLETISNALGAGA